jgi:hypothetical protein
MSRIHWVDRGTGTGIPKEKDDVNRREVSECDVMGDPSKLSVIRKTTALVRVRATLFLNC